MLLDSLKSVQEGFKADTQKMRRAIRWSNYKPVTASLKNSDDVIFIKRDLPKIAYQEEKRIYKLISEGVQRFKAKKEGALNIVPPKLCLDFKRKLKNKFEVLDQKFDFAVLDLLKEKAEKQKEEEKLEEEGEQDKKSRQTSDQEGKSKDQLIGN